MVLSRLCRHIGAIFNYLSNEKAKTLPIVVKSMFLQKFFVDNTRHKLTFNPIENFHDSR